MMLAEVVGQSGAWSIPWYWYLCAMPILAFHYNSVKTVTTGIHWITGEFGAAQFLRQVAGVIAGALTGAALGLAAVAYAGVIFAHRGTAGLPDDSLWRGTSWGLGMGVVWAYVTVTTMPAKEVDENKPKT